MQTSLRFEGIARRKRGYRTGHLRVKSVPLVALRSGLAKVKLAGLTLREVGEDPFGTAGSFPMMQMGSATDQVYRLAAFLMNGRTKQPGDRFPIGWECGQRKYAVATEELLKRARKVASSTGYPA